MQVKRQKKKTPNGKLFQGDVTIMFQVHVHLRMESVAGMMLVQGRMISMYLMAPQQQRQEVHRQIIPQGRPQVKSCNLS